MFKKIKYFHSSNIRCLFFFLFLPLIGKPIIKSPETSLLRFEENKNQWEDHILFQSPFMGGQVFLEKRCFTYMFYQPELFEQFHPGHSNEIVNIKYHSLKVNFINANIHAQIKGEKPYSNYSNYFTGNDLTKWASHVLSYPTITYANLWPNIDMKVYSDYNNVKYDFIVQPGASTHIIELNYQGADQMKIDNNNLMIATSVGEIIEQKPYAYQIINDIKVEVPCFYKLNNGIVSFHFPKGYNKKLPLIIDPTLVFSTFSGSTADNWGMTATFDLSGNAYTGGVVFRLGYPTTVGAYQTFFAGGGTGGDPILKVDMSISKFNSTGTSLIYSTYLGGSNNEQPMSLVVSPQNELYIYGRTYSSNFPTTNGSWDQSYNGNSDIVISKLNSTGTQLLASTFIGGSGNEGVNITAIEFQQSSLKYNYADDGRGEIILDANNNVYICSSTNSADFPNTTNTISGVQDACVFKLNSNLSSLLWSRYIGGSANDAGYGIALDKSLNIYVTGGTESSNFPFTPGALNVVYQGNIDGFLTHIKNDGSAILESSFIGSNSYDQSYFVQTDKNDNVYIYGQTGSTNLPSTYPVTIASTQTTIYNNIGSGQFIHKLNSTLSATIYSTLFGTGKGTPDISPTAFLVDKCEQIYISGWGGGLNGPTSTTYSLEVTSDAFQGTTDGNDFYFAVFYQDLTSLYYATFFGGQTIREHVDGGTSRFDKNGIIYQSICGGCGGQSTMPTYPANVWSKTNKSTNCNNAVVKFDLLLTISNAQASASPIDTGCIGFEMRFLNTGKGQNFEWDFGDGSPHFFNNIITDTIKHIYSNTGTYTLTVIASDPASCNISDTSQFKVTIIPEPSDIGNDTVLCGVSSIILDAGNAGSSYMWNTGETTSTITVTTPNTYSVNVNNGYCSKTFDQKIAIVIDPPVGNDTTLCQGQSLTLNAGYSDNSYLWSPTGEITQSITVTTSANYSVTVSNGPCTKTNSINVTFNAIPTVNLGNDTTLCPQNSITLDAANPGNSYLWNNNITTQTIIVDLPGEYRVEVTNGPCANSDSINVIYTDSIDLGPDFILCDVTDVLLDAGNPNMNYLWSTGETTQTIQVSTPGWYWVKTLVSNCILSDSVQATGFYGAENMYFPNTITPNNDGLNDFFTGYGTEVISFEMDIFDRWGEKIHYTTDINEGWDGTYKGGIVKNGVYIYIIKYQTRCTGDEIISSVGYVIVIK